MCFGAAGKGQVGDAVGVCWKGDGVVGDGWNLETSHLKSGDKSLAYSYMDLITRYAYPA